MVSISKFSNMAFMEMVLKKLIIKEFFINIPKMEQQAPPIGGWKYYYSSLYDSLEINQPHIIQRPEINNDPKIISDIIKSITKNSENI